MGEIIWDMRDIIGDKEEKVMTIPVVYGLLKTRLLLLSILSFVNLLKFLLYNEFDFILILFYLTFILLASPKLPKWLFHFPLFVSLFYYIYDYI